jgi:hypothetical protein
MQVQSTQVKVTIPQQLNNFLKLKAQRMGLPVAGYVKYLIIDDVADLADQANANPVVELHQQLVKKVGKVAEKQKLSEKQLFKELKQTRKQIFKKKYGDFK